LTPDRRRILRAASAGAAALALPLHAGAAPKLPFQRLAVAEPPFEEEYEVLIAMAPPLARGMVGTVLTQVVTRTDAELKTERLTEVLDPDKTRLHQHFVQALADALADADAQVLRVPVEAAASEDALFAQLRQRAPQADGVLLANVMGRFVALHGLASYAPGVIAGTKAMNPRTGKVWLEQVYTAGFRGIDPRASHLEVVDMPERFDNVSTLVLHADRARDALIRGAEAIGAEVGRRLIASAR
jgi:hypothetical protein